MATNMTNVDSESIFCQILGKDTKGAKCNIMQGQSECFGCAATTRLCEDCKTNYVDIPAVGLCSSCSILQLDRESKIKSIIAPGEKVNCDLVKRNISAEMCRATQGQEGCRQCSATSRTCEKCKEHPCRFPQYGLCLKCSIDEYGDGWVAKNSTIRSNRQTSPVISKVVQLTKNGLKLDIRVKRMDMEKTKDIKPKKSATSLMPSVRKFLIGIDKVSAALIAREFKIPYYQARVVIDKLVAEKLIGKSRGPGPRWVINKAMIKNKELCSNCKELPLFNKKRHLCKQCAKYLFNHGCLPTFDTTGKAIKISKKHGTKKKPSPTKNSRKSFVDNLSLQQKISELNQIIDTFGEGKLSDLLRSIVSELKKWKKIKSIVGKV